MGKKIWTSKHEKTAEPFEVPDDFGNEPAAAEPVAEEPAAEPLEKEPAVVHETYVLGYNHDKMRQECGKCKGTQVLVTGSLKDVHGKKSGLIFTCNDCKQTYDVLNGK